LLGDVGFNRHTGIQAMVTKDGGGGCKGGKIGCIIIPSPTLPRGSVRRDSKRYTTRSNGS
jgi:hypothetical protein